MRVSKRVPTLSCGSAIERTVRDDRHVEAVFLEQTHLRVSLREVELRNTVLKTLIGDDGQAADRREAVGA